MLEHGRLFFSRLDRFDDPFEGSVNQPTIELLDEALKPYSAQTSGRLVFEQTLPKLRKWTMVNCWHMNDFESAAMWKLYAVLDRAIAVQSTYGRLRESLKDATESIFIGKINYISYEADRMPVRNMFHPFLHKRRSFEHERELRAIVQFTEDAFKNEKEPPEDGIWVNCDLDILVEHICVSPSSPKWFRELLQQILKRYGRAFTLQQSSLAAKPLF